MRVGVHGAEVVETPQSDRPWSRETNLCEGTAMTAEPPQNFVCRLYASHRALDDSKWRRADQSPGQYKIREG